MTSSTEWHNFIMTVYGSYQRDSVDNTSTTIAYPKLEIKRIQSITIDVEFGELQPLLGLRTVQSPQKKSSHTAVCFIVLSILLIGGTYIGIHLLMQQNVAPKFNAPIHLVENVQPILSVSTSPFTQMRLAEIVFVNSGLPKCTNKIECLTSINSAAKLPYNFLIGGDGHVYKVQGWQNESGIEVTNYRQAFVIGFIGKCKLLAACETKAASQKKT